MLFFHYWGETPFTALLCLRGRRELLQWDIVLNYRFSNLSFAFSLPFFSAGIVQYPWWIGPRPRLISYKLYISERLEIMPMQGNQNIKNPVASWQFGGPKVGHSAKHRARNGKPALRRQIAAPRMGPTKACYSWYSGYDHVRVRCICCGVRELVINQQRSVTSDQSTGVSV